MKRKYLDFDKLESWEKETYLEHTWCDKCNKADLGIKEPLLYIEEKKTYIEGKCLICGQTQKSEIVIKNKIEC